MTRTTRLTEQLTWNYLKEVYFIGNITSEELARDAEGNIILTNNQPKVVHTTKMVNRLQEAIDAGEIDKLVVECAKMYHDGNTDAVYYAMARTLDSMRHNLKDRAYAPTLKIDTIRLETLTTYVRTKRKTAVKASGSIPQWAFGPAEIDAIDDPARLQKVINSINDVVSDAKINKSYAERLGEDYKEVAKRNREHARKRKELLQKKETAVDPDLLAKLATGKNVSLTAEQAALIAKLLGTNS